MPMLAERRRKTKWTNPGRQALWNRDSGDATFGREMMEKMGWKVGQGLGANEQGIKEPLKISFKNDNKGVGFKDNDNEWIQQQSEFDKFLSKLSFEEKGLSKDPQTNTVQSLEERSRLSKARVHYHKFTSGKDLTKYSKKDLECILGRNEKESFEISGNTESCSENIGNEDKSLITAGSMVDYFAKKIQSKKKKKDDSLNIMDPKIGESSLGSRSKDETEENVIESTMELQEKRKKKTKHKKEKDEGGCNEGPCDERDINGSDHRMISSSKEGKKRKKTKIVQEDDQSYPLEGSRGYENETTETELVGIPKEGEEENVYDRTLEGDGVAGEKIKKKKKKRKKEENLFEQFDTENVEALNVFENKDRECKETQEKGDSLTFTEGVGKKKKTSKRDRRVITDEDDEGGSKEKIKKKKKCLEAENRFNYEDFETNKSDLNPGSHTETDFKKETEERKTKCESAVGNKREREGIAGEDPLLYKEELLKKENSLKGTSRNKLLNLIYSTNIEQFSGSNLRGLSGYGIVSHRC